MPLECRHLLLAYKYRLSILLSSPIGIAHSVNYADTPSDAGDCESGILAARGLVESVD